MLYVIVVEEFLGAGSGRERVVLCMGSRAEKLR